MACWFQDLQERLVHVFLVQELLCGQVSDCLPAMFPHAEHQSFIATVPEAMVIQDPSAEFISDIGDTDSFSAVGVGPGLGTGDETQKALYQLLD